jgi:hypothetical protein
MDERLKKTIVGASLFAFGTHTFDLAHEGVIGHEMPSALHFVQIAAGSGVAATTSTATVSIAFYGTVPKTSFGNSSTEAVYPNVPDTKVLKSDGVTVPTPPNGGSKT